MKDWIYKILGHPLFVIIAIISFILIALLTDNIIKRIVDGYNDFEKIKFKKNRSIFIGIAIPLIWILFWIFNYFPLIDEYKTSWATAKGYITDVREDSDIIEYNDGRSARAVLLYYYSYKFKIPNGKIITGVGTENGSFPEYWYGEDGEVNYPVIIEYLPNNPEKNRIKSESNESFYKRFEYPIRSGIASLIICLIVGAIFIKGGIKTYKEELENLERHKRIHTRY